MRELNELIHIITESPERAHAYIVEGSAGSVRDDFMKNIISGIACLDVDLVRMNKSGKTGYVREDALAFAERLGMSPYGRYLVGIIDDAELMNETVQNKLLKTLEEPPENVLIFLVTSRSDELLRTVRSRCSLVRMQEFEGYIDEDAEKRNEEIMSGVYMLLTQRGCFYEFREFLDKHIKTREDAIHFISSTEDRLRQSIAEGKAVKLCADMIETAEMTAMDIIKGMDKNKALRRLYLELCSSRTYRA